MAERSDKTDVGDARRWVYRKPRWKFGRPRSSRPPGLAAGSLHSREQSSAHGGMALSPGWLPGPFERAEKAQAVGLGG
jgi:hypothetical protein